VKDQTESEDNVPSERWRGGRRFVTVDSGAIRSASRLPRKPVSQPQTPGALELSGYALKMLGENSKFVFYRGFSEGDSSSVLVVAPASDHASPGSLKRLEHEYSLKPLLDPEWAARPITFARREGRTLLLLEDRGGVPLKQLLGEPLELTRFLRLAIGLAVALGKLNRSGLIHKDLKPDNILVDCATCHVWLTGFGIALALPRERQLPEPAEIIAGTLPYMAPEQTGRMNRSTDSRSDLYSYGVILYEMLTGTLPFRATDAMEWVHCHIARQPLAPTERIEEIPGPVSAMVMKLLAKTAEERYQTAAGVEADLRRCLAEWESRGQIEPFRLGEYDLPDRLLMPEKLYGRATECQTLLAAFNRVVASGTPELMLLSGYSGIGKSSVVNELHKAIVPLRGGFISGKFDQHKRHIPYSTLAEALQTLVRQILVKREEEVGGWRETIRGAVGTNGMLMVNLIPELELIIGKQQPVPELPPREAQNRFDAVLRRFLGAFARREHPLVLFLDDLQWLDPASLKLLEQFITTPDIRHLLLIGAYRENEVTPCHPLKLTLNSIPKTRAIVNEIVLRPLSPEEVIQLVGDALRCEGAYAQPLGELVHEKTGGNPFFAIQFLTALAEEQLLEFDASETAWRWDLNRIRAKGFSDNVVKLMMSKLKRLPAITQEALRQLACLGNSAEIATLSMVHGESEGEVRSHLWEAVRGGLVLRLGDSYKFLHDQVQEAAYALIPENLRAQFHLRIGRLLIEKSAPNEIEEKIFDIVNQLNLGLALISDLDEKDRVAGLNLVAGKKAKASTAYDPACTYLSLGMELLGAEGWERQYELAFGLWIERAECEFLSANFDEADRLISELLRRGKSKIDRAAAYRLKVLLHLMQADNPQAVRSALECLRMFGIEMQANPTRELVQMEYERIWLSLGRRSIESLIDLRLMTDPEMRAAMSLLSVLTRSAYFTDSNLHRLLVCHMVNLTLNYGTTEASTHGYAWFAVILGPVFRRYDDGHRFAKLAIDLVEKREFAAWKAGAYDAMQMAAIWTRPIQVALDFLQTAFSAAIDSGDVVFACYSLEHAVTCLLARGDHLDEVWLESMKVLDFAQKAKFRHVADVILSIQLFVQNMRGEHASSSTFEGMSIDEQALEARLAQGGLPIVVCWYWILKLRTRFMAGDYEAAIDAARSAKPLLWSSQCHIQLVDYYYYGALALAAFYAGALPDRQSDLREQLEVSLEPLREWAEKCSPNFLDKYTLVSAEVARIEGRDLAAMRLYEKAIRVAHDNGFVPNAGISSELAARFYFDCGLETNALAHLKEARYCYLRWGALGKVKQLDQRYPSIAEQAPLRSATSISAPVDKLDLGTVMKASHAVSGEIVLDKLVETLLVIAVEHAGAEHGILILPRGEEYWIEAEARTHQDKFEVHLGQRTVMPSDLPESLLRYVIRTQKITILDDASAENLFSEDEYVRQSRPRSVLCLPLVKQAKLMGVLYLENNLAPRVFTPNRLAVLELLASQAAISLDNARLYAELTQENNDRKRAEQALRESEQRLQDIIDNTTAVVFVKDLQLHYLLVNREFERRHQVQRDQFRGKTDFDIHPHEVAEEIRANDRRVIGASAPLQFEEAVPSVEGERYYVIVKFLLHDRTGKPYAVCGIATDITESKRAEEMQAALAREREMFAQQRAAELGRANEALRGCLDALASVPQLDEFLGQVMAAITRQLGAASSVLRLRNFGQNSLNLDLIFQDDRVMTPAEANYPEKLRCTPLNERELGLLNQPAAIVHLLNQTTPLPDGHRSYLLELGFKTLLVIPLTIARQLIGNLSFRFAEDREFRPEEIEIARALATQASLAIQLTRLAETGRQAAVLEERNRLSGEIHDSLTQTFAAIAIQLNVASDVIQTREGDGLGHLAKAKDLARFGQAEAHRSALGLHPLMLPQTGLTEAIRMLVERSNIPGRLQCTLNCSDLLPNDLPPESQHNLLRIAQEAISNAVRHANPTTICVTLRCNHSDLELEVRDNGDGIPAAKLLSQSGLGMFNMRNRAKKLGATFVLRTEIGDGTAIVVRLPIHR